MPSRSTETAEPSGQATSHRWNGDLFALGDSLVAFAEQHLGTPFGAIQIRDWDSTITSRFPGPLSDTSNEEGLSHDDPEG
jgi:hypothetical protein